MDEYDLQRVEELFQAAADLEPEQRTAYLERQCPEPGLREHVQSLLSRLDQDATLAAPVAEASAGGVIPECPGTIIDRYKLLQVIGEGGFGVVYMAEQQEPVVRKVALKIIKLGMETREVVARFEAERQALAMMDHPHIARVLDGGATQSGRPYFVMELVRGVAITEFCDRNDLNTRERLELVEQVCHAVQHAHQKGVIHRDIKPSNVLVTLHDGQPMPKVIDFGVAKAMHTRLTEKTLFTRFEQFLGTPVYMSPEQAEMSALDVDTRTDIYSLGVLLYELLTGTTPFDLHKSGLAEIQRIIREEDPPRPSVRISTSGDAAVARHRGLDARSLSRLVRGDLDWIVMRAMEKDRTRRYANVSEFAQDIRRHLRRQPVVAGPPGAAYRVRRFVARNHVVVISGLLIALALVGGIIATTMARFEAERQAELAEDEAARATSVLEFLISTLSLTDRDVSLDPDVTVRTLLESTATRVSSDLADHTWAEARIRSTIGRAYNALSEYALAEPQLRQSVALVDAMTAESDDPHQVPEYDGGELYTTLWALTNAAFYLERDDAFAVAKRARTVGMQHIGVTHPQLAETLKAFMHAVEQSVWTHDSGESPHAAEAIRQLCREATTQSRLDLPHGDPHWPIVADLLTSAGYLVWYTPSETLSIDFWESALAIQQRELPAHHPDTATTVGLLVNILNRNGRSIEAEQLMRTSIASLKRVYREGDFPLAVAQSTLGESLIHQERFEEAETLLLASHDVIVRTTKRESNFMAVESVLKLIQLYDRWGKQDMARPYRDSLARTAANYRYVVHWPILGSAFGPEHEPLASLGARICEHCKGVSYLVSHGEHVSPALEPLLQQFVESRRKLLADESDRALALGRLLLAWANALDRERHIEERRLIAQEVQMLFADRSTQQPLVLASALAMLADVALLDGEEETAMRHGRAAWELVTNHGLQGTWFIVADGARVARTLLALGLDAEAESLLLPVHEIFIAQLGHANRDTRYVRGLLHDLYQRHGRADDIASLGSEPEID